MYLDLARISRVEGIRIEGRERTDRGGARGHRVRVLGHRAEEALEVLVDHRVECDRVLESIEFGLGRQVAVDQEVGDLDERAVCGQFFDGDSAVTALRSRLVPSWWSSMTRVI